MKNTKRILLAAVAALLLVAVSVGGTLAWLTDSTQTITNTFSPSDISITLTEDAGKDSNYQFHMVPGLSITKDPLITVAPNSEPCWLFVKIEKGNNFDTFMKYGLVSDWQQLNESNGNPVDGVFYQQVEGKSSLQTFKILDGDKVTVRQEVTKEMMNGVGSNYPSIKFTAYAVQLKSGDNSEFTPIQAWEIANPTGTP